MLAGKTIILGVTGGIAAYKAANLASLLKKQHADVHVIMTKNAQQFITPCGSGHGQCAVQAGPRAGGRHADHYAVGLSVPETGSARHEYQNV